jgi:hypothetical protein
MAANPNLDRLERRVMFAMDFRDPVTRLPVVEGLKVSAEGLGPPLRAPSGRFVWFDRDPPAERDVRVTALSTDGRFLDFEEVITAPAHVPDIPAFDLSMARTLRPTGLYEPPEGMTGIAGWLVEDQGRIAVTDAEVSIAFRHAGNQLFVSDYKAVTDKSGGFVAVANDLGDIVPDPAPSGSEANILGWLVVARPAQPARFTVMLPLRAGRVARIAAPLQWKDLQTAPP